MTNASASASTSAGVSPRSSAISPASLSPTTKLISSSNSSYDFLNPTSTYSLALYEEVDFIFRKMLDTHCFSFIEKAPDLPDIPHKQ
eukprot:Awhi_evm1s9055